MCVPFVCALVLRGAARRRRSGDKGDLQRVLFAREAPGKWAVHLGRQDNAGPALSTTLQSTDNHSLYYILFLYVSLALRQYENTVTIMTRHIGFCSRKTRETRYIPNRPSAADIQRKYGDDFFGEVDP